MMLKIRMILSAVLLASCASTPYDPFLDDRISKDPVCQKSLNTLVANNVFSETKRLVDRKCNNIIARGWVKGNLSDSKDSICMSSFHYLKERPRLQKTAKAFIKNGCYQRHPMKFFWAATIK